MVTGQKYHTLYKTTCTVTGNFYIGVHSTTNLEDGYMGSGLRLTRSLSKHGKENHVREILEFFDDKEKMYKREREVVNEEMLRDVRCMNLKRGGEGGWNSETQSRAGKIGHLKALPLARKALMEKMKNPVFRDHMINSRSETMLKNTGSRNGKKGTVQTEKWKKMIGEHNSIAQKGEKNSQYGTIWVFDEDTRVNRKVKIENIDQFLISGWKKGRKKF